LRIEKKKQQFSQLLNKNKLFAFWEEVIFPEECWETRSDFPENTLDSGLEETGCKLMLNRFTNFGVKRSGLVLVIWFGCG